MRVRPRKRTSTILESSTLRAAATSVQQADGSATLDSTRSGLVPIAEAVSALLDRNAAYVLLAQECRSRIEALAPRQRDVLTGLVAGQRNKQIARTLGISPRTIEIYRADMMSRLEARTLAQALHIAFVAGLVPSDTMSLGNG